MLKRLTFLSVLVLVVLVWGWPAVAAEPAADRAESVGSAAGAKVAGDILWHCDVQSMPDDNQILGIETFRDTFYLTGAGGTAHPDTNRVHVWTMPGGICTYQYTVPQPTTSSWGWRDIACDGQFLYASDDRTLECFYVTTGGVVLVPANNITISGMTDISVIRGVAYDEDHDWFWTADFTSQIYAFDRTGNMVSGPHANVMGNIYGMAYDNSSPGGPWLWCHVQDSTNVYQFDPSTGTHTALVYSGWCDQDPGCSGSAGGLCVVEGDPSKGSVTLGGITQASPFDEMYGMEIHVEEWADHKMHFPQLPDPEGWDVAATAGYVSHAGIILADDFMCTETGPITGIHFWGSWVWDDTAAIIGFWLSIYDNIPGPPWSMPGAELWSAYVTDYETTPDGSGPQGWLDPLTGWYQDANHVDYSRYDIDSIPQPFYQDSGTIYWLSIVADIGPPGYTPGIPEPPLWGWKTTTDAFMDEAVWAEWTPPNLSWSSLHDPTGGMSLDLAFVITTSEVPIICGDVNNDGIINIGDVVYLIGYLYRGDPPPVPMECVGDVNNDDIVNIGDVVSLISYLYRGGPPPEPDCCSPPWK